MIFAGGDVVPQVIRVITQEFRCFMHEVAGGMDLMPVLDVRSCFSMNEIFYSFDAIINRLTKAMLTLAQKHQV
jgi:hypothetical protein